MFTVKTMRNEGSEIPHVSIDEQIDTDGNFIIDSANPEKHVSVNNQVVSPATDDSESPEQSCGSIIENTTLVERNDSFKVQSTSTDAIPSYENVICSSGINSSTPLPPDSIINEDGVFASFENIACNTTSLVNSGAQKFMLIPLSVAASEVDNRYSNTELQTAVAAIHDSTDTEIQQSILMTGAEPGGTMHSLQDGASQQIQGFIDVPGSQQFCIKTANNKPERKPSAHHLLKVTSSEQACKSEMLDYLETSKGRRGRPRSTYSKKTYDLSQNTKVKTETVEDFLDRSNDRVSTNFPSDNASNGQSNMMEGASRDAGSCKRGSNKEASCSESTQNKSVLYDLDKYVQTTTNNEKKTNTSCSNIGNTGKFTATDLTAVKRSDKTKSNESQEGQNMKVVDNCPMQAMRRGRKREVSGRLTQDSKTGNKAKQTSEVTSKFNSSSVKKCRRDLEIQTSNKLKGRHASETSKKNADSELESRHDFYRMTVFKDKCVVTLAPVTIKTMQQKEMIIEVEISDDLKVVNKSSKSQSSSGLSLYTLSVTKPASAHHTVYTSSDHEVTPTSKHALKAEGESSAKHQKGVQRKRQEFKGLKKMVCRTRKQKAAVKDIKEETGIKNMAVKDGSEDNASQDVQQDADNLETVTEQIIMSDRYKIDPLSVITASLGFQSDIDITSTQHKLENGLNQAAGEISVAVGSQVEENALEQPLNASTQGNKTLHPKNVKAPRTYITRVTEDGTRMYGCPLCGHESRYSQNMLTHIREHSNLKDYVCEECGLSFKTNNRLTKHAVVHRRDRPFTCPICPKAFKSHKVYQCLLCSHATRNRQNMSIHGIQHTGDRPYQCEVCGRTFKGPSNLHTHKRQHSDVLRYNCTLCGRSFRDRATYNQHSRRHAGDKRHVCEHCGKSFVISTDLKKHIRTHTGEKPYKCSVCGKSFADGSGMVRHQKMHNRKTRFECSACLKLFTRKDLCNYHIKKTHGDVGAGNVAVREINVEELTKRGDNYSGESNNSKAEVKMKSKASGTRTNRVYPPKKTWQNLEASKGLQENGQQSYPHERLQLADFQHMGMGLVGATMPQFHTLAATSLHHTEFGGQPSHYYPEHNTVLPPLYPQEPIQNL